MDGIEMRLKEAAVRDAILAALSRSGLQATPDTKVQFVSAQGEPIVIAVTELKMSTLAVPQSAIRPEQVVPPVAPAKESKARAPRLAVKPEVTAAPTSDAEDQLFGGQPAWPEAQPYLPDSDGKIVMPDAGKHKEGQLDDDETVTFDSRRFAVDPVPPGEAPSLRSTTSRAYDVPEPDANVPLAYRAAPSPSDE